MGNIIFEPFSGKKMCIPVVLFVASCFLFPTSGFSKTDVSLSSSSLQEALLNSRTELEQAKTELAKATGALESAERFYGHLLTAILVLVGLSWLWNVRVSDQQIERKVAKAEDSLKRSFEVKQREFDRSIREEFEARVDLQRFRITGVEAQVCRSLGHLWDMREAFTISYIWWMRSAKAWNEIEDIGMVKITLDAASAALKKSSGISVGEPKHLAEVQGIIENLKLEAYKSEKQNLEVNFKEALTRSARV